ncbi:MAG: exonuclease domain-containing protein [Ruminococcus flavefaciens]|nr:exonuclease domain-containing protein [Ruminococcus flavefaciens]
MCQYAIVDLEMCRVPYEMRKSNYHWKNETIQIGAVLLNESLEIEDEFSTYVCPQFGFIDAYINNLTGISKSNVNKAPNMEEALRKFINWLPSDVKVVSWSRNDELQIRREIEAKKIFIEGLENILDNWIDCQKIFGDKMNSSKSYKLSEALVAADIMYEDGAHDGLVDAYNTALLFAKIEREPQLVLNPYYQNAISDEDSSSGFTIGNLFTNIDLKSLVMV